MIEVISVLSWVNMVLCEYVWLIVRMLYEL